MFNFLSEGSFGGQKFVIIKNGGKEIALALGSVALVGVLTGCGDAVTVETPTVPETSVIDSTNETASNGLSLGAQLAEIQKKYDELKKSQGYVVGIDDTYTPSDWDSFVDESLKVVKGKINNNSDVRFELALAVLNIDYLSQTGEKVLAEQFSRGENVESVLNAQYSLASQIREWNTEITSGDDYISYTRVLLSEVDKEIVAHLEEYVKEIITLKQDLTDENKARIQDIFDNILAFVSGTCTIEMTVCGETKAISELDLSRGAVLAVENISQTISVMSKDAVSQELREQLDSELRSKDTLAKIQELIIKYSTIGTLDGVNTELQTKIFVTYKKSFAKVESELAVMDVTSDESKALYTLCNIDFFVNSLESQNIFDLIYADGIDINSMFKLAESAISKIVVYNDSQATVGDTYDMARLVFTNTGDAVSLRAFAQTAYNVNSTDANVVAAAINTIKGYSQYSSDVTVDYQTQDSEGNVVEHSLDKNALSNGATQVINFYAYYSVINHKSIYGADADAILPLVDGSQDELSPYNLIVSMVADHCADRNIIVYDYIMDAATQGQK